MTEFVLIAPLMLVMFLGVLQLSQLYTVYQVAHYAAFAACRAAIVRPCAAFHPDDSNVAHYTPAVFAAAVYSMMTVAPKHDLNFVDADVPDSRIPDVPSTNLVDGLDYTNPPLGGVVENKFRNAQCLTGIRRVSSTPEGNRPVVWTPHPMGPSVAPCYDDDGLVNQLQQQTVPPPGYDLTLEVTFIYPMIIPFINRVLYGIFINYSDFSASRGLTPLPLVSPHEDVMPLPTKILARPPAGNWQAHIQATLVDLVNYYNYDGGAPGRMVTLSQKLADEQWFPLAVRARCTLTVEGSYYPLIHP